jgi:hypothetical protein
MCEDQSAKLIGILYTEHLHMDRLQHGFGCNRNNNGGHKFLQKLLLELPDLNSNKIRQPAA